MAQVNLNLPNILKLQRKRLWELRRGILLDGAKTEEELLDIVISDLDFVTQRLYHWEAVTDFVEGINPYRTCHGSFQEIRPNVYVCQGCEVCMTPCPYCDKED